MPGPSFEFGEFRLQPEERLLLRGGQPVPLTPKAFDTLVALVEWRDRVAEKSELMRRLWPDQVVEEANLTQQIFTLRKALGDTPEGNLYIHTVPRRGYRFVAEVKPAGPAAGAAAVRPAGRPWKLPAALAGVLALAALLYLVPRRRAAGSDRSLVLAVLPFQNLTEDPDDDYLADGLTEEVITELARLSPARLGVIARTSVMSYKTRPKPVREVASELHADYILEGSVRRSGQRLRITAQLIEARHETHLWAEVYEQEPSDVFGLESRMAEAIGQRLSIRLLPRVRSQAPAPSPEAHMTYLRGLYFWNKRSEEGLRRAITLFRQALDLSPGYAKARAGLATSYARLATSADAMQARQARDLADAEARRALELEPELPEGHAALASVRCQFDWNWSECGAELERTVALDPNYASGHQWLGEYLVQRGRFAAGLEELKKARALDPVSASIHTNLGIGYMYARRYDEALACFGEALELEPDFLLAHRVEGLTLVRSGRVEEGLASLQRAVAQSPRSAHATADLGYALGHTGREAEAREALKALESLHRERPVSPYDFALVHVGLGETQPALDRLEQGYAERVTGMRWIKIDPIFDPLRHEPRFQELLRRVGLPD